MRRGALLLLVAGLLAGCGGSGGSKGNGEADRTADQIVADATAATHTATSVHVAGARTTGGTPLKVDLLLVSGKGGKGTITANGVTFQLVRIGPDAYFKGDATFWRQFGGKGLAELLNGRWLKASATTGQLSAFTPLTDVGKFFDAVLGSHGTLEKGEQTTIDGHKAIAVKDASQGGTLYVSTTGKAYPVAIDTRPGGDRITFSAWDEDVTLKPPANAVDFSSLGK
jgi:hypothetical protein